jgi:hypothetical protein
MNELSIGAWIAIITTALGIGATLIKFGELKSDTRNLKKNTEDAVERMEQTMTRELEEIKEHLREVLTFIHTSQQQRVADAGWQERTTANLNSAMKDAEQARETAHSARNIATEALIAANKGKVA